MALNVVLMTQKQSPKGLCLTWSPMEGVASYSVFIASKKLTPDELSSAVASAGNDDCTVVKLGPAATSVIDDISPQGESHFYGVAMNFGDGTAHAARVRIVPDGGKSDSLTLTGAGAKKLAVRPAAAAPAPAAAPVPAPAPAAAAAASAGSPAPASIAARMPTGNTGSFRIGTASPSTAAAASPRPASINTAPASPTGNTGSYRVNSPGASPAGNSGAFRIANNGAPAAAPAATPVEDEMEARRRAQAAARAHRRGGRSRRVAEARA